MEPFAVLSCSLITTDSHKTPRLHHDMNVAGGHDQNKDDTNGHPNMERGTNTCRACYRQLGNAESRRKQSFLGKNTAISYPIASGQS